VVRLGGKLKKGSGIFLMGWDRLAGAEIMPSLVGGNTEIVCGKLMNHNGVSKPNFELGPSVSANCAVSNLFNLGRHLVRAEHYRNLRISAFAEWSRAVA
jgi:hypothetical protein